MSPLRVFKENELLATIGKEGGACRVLRDVDVYYMGDESRLYAVGENEQLVERGQIATDIPCGTGYS